MIDLKPCPFCQSDAICTIREYFGDDNYKILCECKSCDAEAGIESFHTGQDLREAIIESIETWNKRLEAKE